MSSAISLNLVPHDLAQRAAAGFNALVAALRPAAPPKVRDRAREAAHVRAMALQIQQSDPRFAVELLAAADRHESLPDA